MLLFVNPQIEFRVPTGFGAKTEVKTPKHPSIKDFIFYDSHFLPIWPKPKYNHCSNPGNYYVNKFSVLEIEEDCQKKSYHLTHREKDVLAYLIKGLSNEEIARE